VHPTSPVTSVIYALLTRDPWIANPTNELVGQCCPLMNKTKKNISWHLLAWTLAISLARNGVGGSPEAIGSEKAGTP